jgi:hypothetical protein
MQVVKFNVKNRPAIETVLAEVCCGVAGLAAEEFLDGAGPGSLALHEAGHAILHRIRGATRIQAAIAPEFGSGFVSCGVGCDVFKKQPDAKEIQSFAWKATEDTFKAESLMELVFGSLGMENSEEAVKQFMKRVRAHVSFLLKKNESTLTKLALILERDQWVPAEKMGEFFDKNPIQGSIDVEVLMGSVMLLAMPSPVRAM